MILALEAASPITRLWFIDGTPTVGPDVEWESGRTLADELLGKLVSELGERQLKLTDLTGIIIFSGPGSFTSLRIGHTVANALADSLNIPIIGAQGDSWLQIGLDRIKANKNDRLALPFYGGEANITKPKA